MSKLKLYKPSETLTKGNMVRLDSPLFIAVMSEAINQGIPSYADYIRSVLAAICLDKTHSSNTEQKTLIAGHKYYTESDIKVYESQIDSLDNQLSNYAIELKNKEVFIQKLHEQHEFQLAQLKAKIPSNLGQNQPNQPNLGVFEIEIQPNLGHQSQPQFQTQPTQPPTQFQAGTNLFQAGLELSERGTNQIVPEVVQVDMVELINENFLEVIGNKLVIEYFNQQNKLNQSFGISGFSGTFKVVEEIPNSLLEHHPLVVYWKKQVGQFENAVVNATEAFFEKDNTVQQMTRNEQLALVALTKREQMLWWLITHFTTIRGFEIKYYQYLFDTVRIQCQGFRGSSSKSAKNLLLNLND